MGGANAAYKSDNLTEPIILTGTDLIDSLDYNQWQSLPYGICDGLKCKRIKTPPTHEGFLLKYMAGCETAPHVNIDEHEVLTVKSGHIRNLITGRTYQEGQVMVVNKGEVSATYCDSETYIYLVTTKDMSELNGFI
jgi:hypothetical protein